jgi:hypothetical protein
MLANGEEKSDESNMKERQVVGFFRQSVILFWKNSLLFRRNVSGTICELVVSLLFLLILLILRYFVDNISYSDQDSTTNPLIYVTAAINTTTSRNYIYYYPNNAYIRAIVARAYQIIRSTTPTFSASSKFF